MGKIESSEFKTSWTIKTNKFRKSCEQPSLQQCLEHSVLKRHVWKNAFCPSALDSKSLGPRFEIRIRFAELLGWLYGKWIQYSLNQTMRTAIGLLQSQIVTHYMRICDSAFFDRPMNDHRMLRMAMPSTDVLCASFGLWEPSFNGYCPDHKQWFTFFFGA